MLAEQGAAPAVVPRKRNPGTPRVTVRSYYGEPPLSGLDAGRTNGGETCRDQGGQKPPIRPRKLRSRGAKSPLRSAGWCASPAGDATPQGV